MALKPGRDAKPQNHLPIWLLLKVSKIAEHIILSRLHDDILDFDPIPAVFLSIIYRLGVCGSAAVHPILAKQLPDLYILSGLRGRYRNL